LKGQKGDPGAIGLQGPPGQNGSNTPQQGIARVVGDLTLENFNFGPIAAGRCGQISTNGLEGSMPGDFILATPTNGDRLPGEFTLTGGGVEAPSNGEAILCNHSTVNAAEPTFDVRLVAVRF
jgi:hypothetical protein